jgi:hypothetical protein
VSLVREGWIASGLRSRRTAEQRFSAAGSAIAGGVPWQIVPTALPRLLAHEDRAVAARVFTAMTTMVKLDIAALEHAAKG